MRKGKHKSSINWRKVNIHPLGVVILGFIFVTVILQFSFYVSNIHHEEPRESVDQQAKVQIPLNNHPIALDTLEQHHFELDDFKPPSEPVPPLLMSAPQKKNHFLSFKEQILRHNLSPYQASPLHPDNYNRIKNKRHLQHPRLLHFIFVADLDGEYLSFNWINYLVIRASFFRLQPDAIYFHTNKPPKDCPIWRMIKPMIRKVLYFEPELEIYGNKVSGKAHISDIKRLRVLKEYGGIYMDIDSIALRYFPQKIWTPPSGMSMGWELEKSDHMGVSMISSSQDSPFLQRWIESYRTFNDKRWADHTVLMAGNLTRLYPNEINALPETHFNRPIWKPKQIVLLWKEQPKTATNLFKFEKTYACHYWGTFAREKGRIQRMTPYTIMNENVGVHQILRPLLPHPYFSLVIQCSSTKTELIEHTIRSIISQEFPMWELLLIERPRHRCDNRLYQNIALRHPELLALASKSFKRVYLPEGATVQQATSGLWMIQLKPGEVFSTKHALIHGLNAIRQSKDEFSLEFDKSKTLEFVFRSSDPIVRTHF